MDDQPNITVNCWVFPNKFFVVGGPPLGLSGIELLALFW